MSMKRRVLGLLALATTVFVALPSPAHADDKPVSFGVSAPADVQPARPGELVKTWLGLSNQLDQPMTLQVRMVTMRPADDGKFDVVDSPDPMWAPQVKGPGTVDLPPKGSVRAPVEVQMPEGLAPDIYLIGFVVEPQNKSTEPGAIIVRSQISSFITLEVPGKRHREISVPWHRMPRFQIGRRVHASFRVVNAGLGTALFRGQVRENTFTGRNVAVVQATGEQPMLIPSHTARTVSYTWEASGLLHIGSAHLEVSYPTGSSTMGTVERDGPLMIIIPPETLFVPVALLGVVLLWLSWVKRGRLARGHAATA
jgi:hypothetical protein